MAGNVVRWNVSKLTAVGYDAGVVAVTRRGNRVLNAARRNVSVDSARLKGSLKMEVVRRARGPVARIGSNLKYAMYEEKGTGIYAGRGYITPKSGKYLRWPAKSGRGSTSGYVFAKRIRGRKGTRFLTRALAAAK